MDVSIKLDEQRMQDLFIGAFEGGSSYWAEVRDSSPTNECQSPSERWWKHIMVDGGEMKVYDNEDEESEPTVLNKAGVEKGFQLMAQNEARHFMDWLSENDDATTADVWFQLALFGQVVYG